MVSFVVILAKGLIRMRCFMIGEREIERKLYVGAASMSRGESELEGKSHTADKCTSYESERTRDKSGGGVCMRVDVNRFVCICSADLVPCGCVDSRTFNDTHLLTQI